MTAMVPRARRWAWLAVAAAAGVAVRADAAGPLHGSAELQYQSSEHVGVAPAAETWLKTLRLDYARRLPRAFELASHLVFSEQTMAGRLDRARTPQGTLQLAHPYASLMASFRPSEVRDAKGRTTRQQELGLNGALQLPRAPRLTGTWVRRRYGGAPGAPVPASVTRSVAGTYSLGAANLRAGYGDQYREGVRGPSGRAGESHYNLGAGSQFRVRRAGFTAAYDYTHARNDPTGARPQATRQHTAGLNGSLQVTKRLGSGLAYTFRRTASGAGGSGPLDEHDGSLSLGYQLRPAVQFSSAAGARTARLNGGTQSERYLVASASAQGQVRPGWRADAAASHSLNWLPGASARPVENLRSSSSMHLTRGLDLVTDLSLSAARAPGAGRGAPMEMALQAGGGVNSNPLRTVFVDVAARRYRAGVSLLAGGTSTTTWDTRLRLRPSQRLQLSGGWGLATQVGTRSTTWQAAFNWTPRPTLQASGSYARALQQRGDLGLPVTGVQESFSGSLVAALARDLSATVRYSESNPGRTGSVRQLNVLLVETFGR